MESLYETLEVAEDATTDVIKKAYRSKAQEHHPDKNGDPAMFQMVAEAYNVLKDSGRRKKYDETGSADNKSSASVAESMLAKIFSEMIENNSLHGDLVQRVKEWISKENDLANSCIVGDTQKIRNLENKLGRLKSKGEMNLFDGIIESKISQLKTVIKAQQRNIEGLGIMSEILTDYEDTSPEIVQAPKTAMFVGGLGETPSTTFTPWK